MKILVLLSTIAMLQTCGPKKPLTYTPAPSLSSAKHSITETKSSFKRYNDDINTELNTLEEELKAKK